MARVISRVILRRKVDHHAFNGIGIGGLADKIATVVSGWNGGISVMARNITVAGVICAHCAVQFTEIKDLERKEPKTGLTITYAQCPKCQSLIGLAWQPEPSPSKTSGP